MIKELSVYARWRPVTDSEAEAGEIVYETIEEPGSLSTITVTPQADELKVRPWGTFEVEPWKSLPAFSAVLGPQANNATVYNKVIAAAVPKLMNGANCSFFAYGHSGSGKTHTMVGYDQETDENMGMALASARDLFKLLDEINNAKGVSAGAPGALGIGLSVFEMRGKHVLDLLNNATECDLREGPDGRVHIRGQPEMLESGEVRVNSMVKTPCWNWDTFKSELNKALRLRSVGSSSVHDQSSRSHAVLELEIINQTVLDARAAVIEARAAMVPTGKELDDWRYLLSEIVRRDRGDNSKTKQIDERAKELSRDKAEGQIYRLNKNMSKMQDKVTNAEKHEASTLRSREAPCLGAKLVFVDLAGAEYHKFQAEQHQQQAPQEDGNDEQANDGRDKFQEQQEGVQINTDVMALKEVMRAWAKGAPRVPFRASPLTMVLREYFVGPKRGISAVVVTLSPARERYSATLDSLRYGSLVGAPEAVTTVRTGPVKPPVKGPAESTTVTNTDKGAE
jgi:hypothetical protein